MTEIAILSRRRAVAEFLQQNGFIFLLHCHIMVPAHKELDTFYLLPKGFCLAQMLYVFFLRVQGGHITLPRVRYPVCHMWRKLETTAVSTAGTMQLARSQNAGKTQLAPPHKATTTQLTQRCSQLDYTMPEQRNLLHYTMPELRSWLNDSWFDYTMPDRCSWLDYTMLEKTVGSNTQCRNDAAASMAQVARPQCWDDAADSTTQCRS